MIKISWNESEFLTLFLSAALVILKAGAVFLFLAAVLFHEYRQSPEKFANLPVIIPSSRQFVSEHAEKTAETGRPLQRADGRPAPFPHLSLALEKFLNAPAEPTAAPPESPAPADTAEPAPSATPLPVETSTSPPAPPSEPPEPSATFTPLPSQTPTLAASSTPVATPTAVASEPPARPSPAGTATLIPMLGWPQPDSKVCSPLQGIKIKELDGIISSPYDPPPVGSDERHQGVDFAYYNYRGMISVESHPIQTILPGKVVGLVNNRLPYGNTIMIETRREDVSPDLADMLGITENQSLYHLYAHMKNPPDLVFGQHVSCGQVINQVSNTGTLVPHLHLELRRGPAGGWFPSMGFFDEDTTEEEKSNYLYWRISGTYQHFDPMDVFREYLTHEADS